MVPGHMGPYGLTVYRVIISAGIFWIFYIRHAEKIQWRADGWRLCLAAICGTSVNMLLFYKGISMTSAINGSIIMTLTPVLVLVWATFLIKEKITKKKILGVFIGMLGALIIFYQPNAVFSKGHWQGDLLIFLNAAVYACYLVVVKPLMMKYKPITVATWVFTLAIVIVLPFGYQEALLIDTSVLPMRVISSMIYSILFVTVIVYFLNIWTLVRVDSSVVGSFIYLQPVFATITAILFFDEQFHAKHLLAATCVFAGVWLVTRKSS